MVIASTPVCHCSKFPQGWEALENVAGQPYRHDMVTIFCGLVSIVAFRFRSRASLELRLLALQHQLAVLRRQRPGRPPLSSLDRLLWVWLYRIWPQIIDAMVLVKPATVVQWHRKGVRFYWRWRSRRPGRPKIGTEIRDLIRRMSKADPLWGAPRIHGELLKLGIKISQGHGWALDALATQSPRRLGGASCATTCPTLRRSTCLWSPPRRSSFFIP